MNEQRKIDEAKYFLSRMDPDEKDPTEYSYDLSAFLSAARSALQYALEEARSKTGGQAWYDSAIGAYDITKFLKDKRDLSIHVKPVVPNKTTNVDITESVAVTDALVSITITRADGTVEKSESTESGKPRPSNSTASTSSVFSEFYFQDWSGEEDVNTLCKQYLHQIEIIVSDGRKRGFLT